MTDHAVVSLDHDHVTNRLYLSDAIRLIPSLTVFRCSLCTRGTELSRVSPSRLFLLGPPFSSEPAPATSHLATSLLLVDIIIITSFLIFNHHINLELVSLLSPSSTKLHTKTPLTPPSSFSFKMASRTYNANPFFSSAFFAPSIGEKIDNATAQAQAKAEELKVKGEKMAGVYGDKAYNKLQDAKEIVKDTASTNPTGVDLYSRSVVRRLV